ncbi:uncharacterized protein (DUF1697 family) [Sphingomonas sp. F9_3S_D5_B_2]
MTAFVALLRAVNVGGRKLLMTDLQAIAEELRFEKARTYIGSGNLLFTSTLSEKQVKAALEERLAAHMQAPVPVMVRTANELAAVVKVNPFTSEPGNKVAAIFLDGPPADGTLQTARNVDDERVELGKREVYVAYGEKGMGRSRLRIPDAEAGTARNMNTVAKLAELAKEMA